MKQTVVLKFWNWSDEKYLLKKLEEIGRVSHLSDQKITEDSCYPFIKMIINQRHLGILEHENITFKIRTNRAIANELVRHRHFTFARNPPGMSITIPTTLSSPCHSFPILPILKRTRRARKSSRNYLTSTRNLSRNIKSDRRKTGFSSPWTENHPLCHGQYPKLAPLP